MAGIGCSSGLVGDPGISGHRQCDYRLSLTADFDGDGVVDSEDRYPADASESSDIDYDGLGDNSDPFPQDYTNRADSNWVHCSNDWGPCVLPVPALVRYGVTDNYVYQQVTNSIDCAPPVFGDPAPVVAKQCAYLLSEYRRL